MSERQRCAVGKKNIFFNKRFISTWICDFFTGLNLSIKICVVTGQTESQGYKENLTETRLVLRSSWIFVQVNQKEIQTCIAKKKKTQNIYFEIEIIKWRFKHACQKQRRPWIYCRFEIIRMRFKQACQRQRKLWRHCRLWFSSAKHCFFVCFFLLSAKQTRLVFNINCDRYLISIDLSIHDYCLSIYLFLPIYLPVSICISISF